MKESKWKYKGQNFEGKKYFQKIKNVKLQIPFEPPPAFTPDELAITTSEPPHRILTFAQGVSEALESKEK